MTQKLCNITIEVKLYEKLGVTSLNDGGVAHTQITGENKPYKKSGSFKHKRYNSIEHAVNILLSKLPTRFSNPNNSPIKITFVSECVVGHLLAKKYAITSENWVEQC